MAGPGRPPKPLAADAPPAAAALGAELRRRRLEDGLTLAQLGVRAGYSPQHISCIELTTAGATPTCIGALDAALDADGALLELLPAAVAERLAAAHCRATARRYDKDVDPTNRRGLLGGAAGAAIGAAGLATTPVAAREVDPALPHHYARLLALLGSLDDANGPREVLSVALHELQLIAEHRAAARGELRVELMRVEARWATHAGWLCEDAGDRRRRDAMLDRALHLAHESDYPDVMAWARARQAQWSDAPRALRLAETALRTPRASPQALVLCATRAAHAHARIGDSEAAERMIAKAERLTAQESPPAPLSRNLPHDAAHDVRCWEARCWGTLAPAKAIRLYDGVLRDWPRGEARDGGLFRARLAVACAGAGELDRARSEGRKALQVARATKSATAARELKQLGAVLTAA